MFHLLQGYKPKWLYRLLPYIYAAAGILTMLVLRNGLAIFSGSLLITAGGIAWFERRSFRKAATAGNMPGRINPGLIDIVWRKRYDSGNKLIDNQHRSLFIVANRLTDKITNAESDNAIKETVRELLGDIQTHFTSEEEILEKAAPAMAGAHKAVHAQLLREVRDIADRVLRKKSSLRELIGFVLYDMISNHLTGEDSKFFPLLKR